MPKGKQNLYTCRDCGHGTVTVDNAEGVTPFLSGCPKCDGTSQSAMYQIDQARIATHEWYTPDEKERATLLALVPSMARYLDDGALLCRQIGDEESMDTVLARKMFGGPRQV